MFITIFLFYVIRISIYIWCIWYILSVPFFIPDFNLLSCELDNFAFKVLYIFFYKQSIFDPRPEKCLSFSKKLPQKIV